MEQSLFLEKYNIDEKEFKKTKLVWKELMEIYDDYVKIMPRLEASAIYIFNNLMKTDKVHSVRYRIKDAEHVIEKIIRKKIKDGKSDININNYQVELTDLIGLRALHLFKEDWNIIHTMITSTWDLKNKPVANYREGDSVDYRKKFEELDCDTKEHPFGYRSVHYIVETKPAKARYFAEIQVRTIFEEAWSEIDHTIRYPYDQDNPVFGQFLMILNRLAGSADEMGTFIQFLKIDLENRELLHQQALLEKEHLITQLQDKIKDLKLKKPDLKIITDELNKLKLSSWDNFPLTNLKMLDSFPSITDFSNIKLSPITYIGTGKISDAIKDFDNFAG